MQSSKGSARDRGSFGEVISSDTASVEAAVVRAAALSATGVDSVLRELIGHDTHAKTATAIMGAVLAIGTATTLTLSLVGATLAAIHGILPAQGQKRMDALLVNPHLDLAERGFDYVRFVIGGRNEALIALDWTDFAKDGHTTLCAYLVTTHGRATPLWWKTTRVATIDPEARIALEDGLLGELRRALGPDVRVRLLCDRGFVDSERVALWTLWGWNYVIRIRRNIKVTDKSGVSRRADQWLRGDGRAVRLPGASITKDQQPVGSFIAVQQPGMKDAWFLICDEGVETATEGIALYGRRFSTEETFRDQQDPRFGLGLDHLRLEDPAKRDRLLMLAAMAQVALTLLGAAGEACGLDRGLHRHGGVSNGRKRVFSLFRQGCTWFQLLPTLRPDRRSLLLEAFEAIVRAHRLLFDLIDAV
jgi:Transposase DDE domain